VKYGTIAMSAGTNTWGDSYRYGSRTEAERRALTECAKNARDCKVAVWFNDNCCAVGSADCRKRGGKKCEMQHAVCSR
jgi:hypothetical protein